MTGVILRLNDDGSTPSDNPYFNAVTGLTGEAATNVKKVFAYGVRNGFGLAFDPLAGFLWSQENGDDAFDEMNRVSAGFNGGWIQAMGPLSRINEFKSIESTYPPGNLQQLRWPPSNIADSPQAALARMYVLPGSQYTDPEFSWKYALAPAGIGFVKGRGLGTAFEGDMLVGASRTTLLNGFLFRFKFSPDRKHFQFTDPLLNDRVADNVDKFDVTESESLVAGRDFGVVPDIETGPNGNVYVVSLLNGAVYEIKSKPGTIFYANLNGAQETPPNNSSATGTATVVLSPDETNITVSLNFKGLSNVQTDAHIHSPAPPGTAASPLFGLPLGQVSDFRVNVTPAQVQDLKNGLWYVNVHTVTFPGGEIRGQFGPSATASTVQFAATQVGVGEGEGEGSVALTVTRSGNTSAAADVHYATVDGYSAPDCGEVNTSAASSRCDYASTAGTIHFAAGQTLASFSVPIIDDAYAEGASESFIVALSEVSGAGAVLSSPATIIVTINDNDNVNGHNPIDSTSFFVRQHYLDFLNREPDSAGFAFWKNEIDMCGADAACAEVKRINVSAAFFQSIEFQETGYLVERVYKSAYGDADATSTLGGTAHIINVPMVRFSEFLADTQQTSKDVIVGVGNWQAQLEANKVAFTQNFVTRTRFINAYPTTMTPAEFVDALFQKASIVPAAAERTSIISEFGGAGNTADTAARARALRRVAENATLVAQEKNKAFVLMEYFGYLRRNPNDPQDTDYTGYDYWLQKLIEHNGNYVSAEMVKAFISSIEYRHRFGP